VANKDLANPIKATPAEMSAKMRKLKVIYDLPKIDLDDDQAVADRIDYYFEYCAKEGLKPIVEGLALAIGIDRRTLWDWESERRRGLLSDSRADIIKKAKDYIAFLMSDAAISGQVNPVTWIFYAKNYFGMSDKQEIEIKAKQPLDELPMDEIEKRIPKNLPVDVEYKEE
jgi:hypothetical protein